MGGLLGEKGIWPPSQIIRGGGGWPPGLPSSYAYVMATVKNLPSK